MSDVTAIPQRQDAGLGAADLACGAPADYVSLLQPRVMSLVIFTAVTGLIVAPGEMNPLSAALSTPLLILTAMVNSIF